MSVKKMIGANENTFSHYLANEIEKCGIKDVNPFVTLVTPEGRNEVDILCKHDGLLYPCEAKLSESDLVEAIAKINNRYIKYHEMLGVGAGFAILHPKDIGFQDISKRLAVAKFKVVMLCRPGDMRGINFFEGNLKEIAKFIADSILHAPVPIAPNVDFIINTLRISAKIVTEGLNELRDDALPYVFGHNIFDNILEYSELKATKKEDLQELRVASAYILINQLLFYQILSSKISKLKAIDTDTLSEPKDLKLYFDKVLDINYRVVYGYDVASWIPSKFVEEVKKIVSVIQVLGTEKIGGDLLGTIFHNLIPFEIRKRVAAFYTNPLAAELLASLSINTPYDIVADLSCGSGGLLVASYQQKARLEGQISQHSHMRMLENEIYGSDIMPFAASIAASHLAIQHPEYPTEHVNIAIKDSMTLQPYSKISSIIDTVIDRRGQSTVRDFFGSSSRFSSSVVKNTANSRDISFPMLDVAIMNPPFTRQEKLSKKYKKALNEQLKDYKHYMNGQMSLCGHFVFIADKFLKENGRLAFVIPGTVIRLQSFKGVRDLLKEKYFVRHIIALIAERSAFSESTSLREILLIASKEKPKKDDKVFVSLIKQMPQNTEEVQSLVSIIKANKEFDNDRVKISGYPINDLYKEDNWYRFMAIVDNNLDSIATKIFADKRLVPITSFGKATENDLRHYSYEDFHGFIQKGDIKEDKYKWKVASEAENSIIVNNAITDERIKINKSILGRGLRTPSGVTKMDVSEDGDYLIIGYFDEIKNMAASVIGNKSRDLSSDVTDEWRKNFKNHSSCVAYSYKLNISAPGTSHVAFYSSEPFAGTATRSLPFNEIDGKIAVLWLNSTFGILNTLRERVETEGAYWKMDCYIFNDILVPDPKQLTDAEKKMIIKLFDKVSRINMPSIIEQLTEKDKTRKTIDALWMKILGVDIDLNMLYEQMLSEIKILKSVMKK